MKSAWQALGALTFIFSLSAFAAEDVSRSVVTELPPPPIDLHEGRNWTGEWWAGTSMQTFSEGKDDGFGSAFKLGTQVKYVMAPWARMLFDVEARFYGSQVQAKYEDDIMASSLRLREGYVGFGAEDTFETRFGAISQRYLRSDFLIHGRRAFPGASETFGVGNSKMRFGGYLQQVVPTSYSLLTDRQDREITPTFLTETLSFKITPVKAFEAELYATHYRFNHLPAVVAFKSGTLGNSFTGEDSADSRFVYSFDGFMIGSEFCACLSGPLAFHFGGQWLQNSSAPTDRNRGQVLYLSSEIRLPNEVTVTPGYSVFFIESDVTPAAYNRWDFGNTNRKGSVAKLEINFKRQKFKVGVEYSNSDLISSNPYQNPEKNVLSVGVETDHVQF